MLKPKIPYSSRAPAGEADDIYDMTPLAPDVVDCPAAPTSPVAHHAPEVRLSRRTDRAPFQFSLSDIFVATTGVALMLGLGTLFGRNWRAVAGLSCVGALVSLVLLSRFAPERPWVRVLCWTSLMFYIVACAAALIVG